MHLEKSKGSKRLGWTWGKNLEILRATMTDGQGRQDAHPRLGVASLAQ